MGTTSMTRYRNFSIVITEKGNLRAKHDAGYAFWRMVTRENPNPSFDEAEQIINTLYERVNLEVK